MKTKVLTVFTVSLFLTLILWVLGLAEPFYRFNIFIIEKASALIMSLFEGRI